MEIVHSSAVEPTGPCIVSIYACAKKKEAEEFFSQLSTLYDKRVQLSLGKVHKSLPNAKTSCLQMGHKGFTIIFYPHTLEIQKISWE